MKLPITMKKFVILTFINLIFFTSAFSATVYSVIGASGYWSSGAVWDGGVVPGPGDDVIVYEGSRIRVNASTTCQSLTILGEFGPSFVQVFNGYTLTVNGNLTLVGGDVIGDEAYLYLGRSSATLPTVPAKVLISGNLELNTSNNSRAIIDMTASNGELEIKGNFSLINPTPRGTLSSSSSSKVIFSGTSNQTFPIGDNTSNRNAISFQNIDITNTTGVVSFSNVASNVVSGGSIAGTFTIKSGATFSNGGLAMTGENSNIVLEENSRFSLTGTSTFPTGYTFTANANSIIQYAGSNQTISQPSILSSFPNLTISGTGTKTISGNITIAGDLTVTASTLSAPGSQTITIGGDWAVYGSAGFSEGTSTVIFSGNTNFTTTGGEVFNNLTLNGTSLNLSSPVIINGILNLPAGTLTTNNNLTLSLNTGSIAYNSGDAGSLSGNITYSRSLSNAGTHYIGLPANVAPAQINDDVALINAENGYSRLAKLENGAWVQITDLNTPLPQNQGYSLYIPGAANLDISEAYSHLNAGFSKSFGNSAASFELFGNPYPTAIDWSNASGWTKTNLNNAIYYWNPATSSYASFVGGSGSNGGTQYIPSFQGFLVNPNAANASLSVNNNARTAAQNPNYFRVALSDQVIRLQASSDNYTDETILKLAADGTSEFDGNLDAYKIYNSGSTPSLYTSLNGVNYSINSISDASEEEIIPLNFKAGFAGTYSLAATEIPTEDVEIFLEDKLTGTMNSLSLQPNYEFSAAKGENSSRFFLHVKKSVLTNTTGSADAEQVLVYNVGEQLNVDFRNSVSDPSYLSIYSSNGIEVCKDVALQNSGLNSYNIKNGSGVYIVKITTGNNIVTKKIVINN